MIEHLITDDKLIRKLIRHGVIVLGGNKRLKIYGRLNCKSGKRIKKANRVFFQHEAEAIALGYRPCKNCMKRG